MHATIVQMTRDRSDWKHHVDEVDVFTDNQDKFYDGVEENTGDGFIEDVDNLCSALGEAIAGRGTEKDEDHDVIWVDIDTEKTDALFAEPFSRFRRAVLKLADIAEEMFRADSGYAVSSALQEIREAYEDDWAYVLDSRGYAKPIGVWLRNVRRDAKDENTSVVRFYIHASYDGNQ